MKRTTVNFLVDLIAFVDLIAMIVTGIIIKMVLPPGTGGQGQELHGGQGMSQTKDLLSLTRHEWGDIHFYLSILFIALISLHIILHWTWIKSYVKSHLSTK